MSDTDIIFLGHTDLSGQVRGKGLMRRDYDAGKRAVGWTPTNAFITCFGGIASGPFGALGDVMLTADPDTLVLVEEPDWPLAERFVLGNVSEIADGAPWPLCPRSQLSRVLDRLAADHGLTIKAAFEHEFHVAGAEENAGFSYRLEAHRRLGPFPDRFASVLTRAGLVVENILPEYGSGQVEVSISPRDALRAADEAAILRELARGTARSLGLTASFAPILDPAWVGNGVHVHFSLGDLSGNPVNYDPTRPDDLSDRAGSFLAGILKHLPAVLPFTASAATSYLRLTPHRWSAAYNNLGKQDREAALRICPVFRGADPARAFHFEYRAADASSSPHLALAAILAAGTAGLDANLPAPTPTAEDVSVLPEAVLAERGLVRLPQSLDAALDAAEASPMPRDVFGDLMAEGFVTHKRHEAAAAAQWDVATQCTRYAEVY